VSSELQARNHREGEGRGGSVAASRVIQPCRYADWVSNIVPVEKTNTGKIQICVDFRNFNRATPKHEYPMPTADLLIDSVSGNKVISFLDGNVGYN
jgi:hypothetical protein